MNQSRQFEKGQATRLMDVLLLGPVLVWSAAASSARLPDWARIALLVFGVGTITYNWVNYAANRWPEAYSA